MWRYAAAFILVTFPVHGQSLASRIETILGSGAAARALWGVHVVDAATGRVLCERNAALPMTPASNMKLLTTALALKTFGAEHRFETRVVLTGSGDLVLVGGADPSISGRIYPYVREGTADPRQRLADLARQVAAAGVTRVEGDLIGDDTLHEHEPWPDGWAAGDVPWEYGAPVSALTYNDNAVSITIRPAREAGEGARVSLKPALGWFTIHNTLRVEAGAKREIRLDRLPGSAVVRIYGTAPPGAAAATQWIAVDDPARFAAEEFRKALLEEGVAVMGAARARHRLAGEPWVEPQGRTVAKRLSPPLAEIVTVVNKVSQNLHAELLLREIGRVKRGRGARSAGVEELESWLISLGADKQELALADGSGLSRPALVSPRVITAVLRSMAASADGETFSKSLPVGGVDGTLYARFRGLGDASAIRAKTGTIRHVSALSGYAGPPTGQGVAFSIIANHATAPSQEIRAAIDRIGMAILESLRD
jgi:D-alanyl-D-alanine carboxypeptidase/D-alanyl-D-alanine-endopeptidase (penicillin-binding protein 4)